MNSKLSAKKWSKRWLRKCALWNGPFKFGQKMASPFRRRYLGFRVLGKDEEVRVGDQWYGKMSRKWWPVTEYAIKADLAYLSFGVKMFQTVRRKL